MVEFVNVLNYLSYKNNCKFNWNKDPHKIKRV